MLAPIDYTSGNGFAQGLQLKGLQDENSQRAIAIEQEQKQRAELEAFKQDWQKSFGDPKKMSELVAKYPGQMDAIKSGIGFQDEQHQMALGNAARDLRVAMATGNVAAIQNAAVKNSQLLQSIGSSPEEIIQQYQQDPKALAQTVDAVGLSALGAKDYYTTEQNRAQLAEQTRSNKANESLTARGQNITAQNARLAANAPTSAMQNYQVYSKLLKTDPASAAVFAQAAGINTTDNAKRTVQLSDGRTVTIGGKLHGAGANAFYEGVDNSGNTVRVPASTISAPASSAANAQNYAMKSDIDSIINADPSALNFMTGITGASGSPAVGADVRSRFAGKEQRQLYTAAQRIQGKMQNQGIAAARDMGASGINTVAEAKMYFQGMPQVDYSSPEAMRNSLALIQQYTNSYNQQYNVNVGSPQVQAAAPVPQPAQPAQPASQAPQRAAGNGYSSLWGD